jgi:hypothetical protein
MEVSMGTIPSSKRHAIVIVAIVFLVLAAPTVGAGIYYYRSFDNSLTEQVTSHVQTLEGLSANAMALRLDGLVGLIKNYADQPTLKNAVAGKEWDQGIAAIKTLQDDPAFYDFAIDRIFLLGPDGKINAAFPGIAMANIGTVDPGYPTWSKILLDGHAAAYVSNVVLRSVSPRINVVKVLVPIFQASSTAGFLRFDVPINEFSDLGKNTDLTSSGFVYFTDALGQIVSHPKISSDWPITSFASVPSVDRAIHGKSGVDILYNAIEDEQRVTAYGGVPGYGWAVVALEPVDQAFAPRDAILNRILLTLIATLLIEAGFAVAIGVWKRKSSGNATT